MSEVAAGIFRAYDVRGIVGDDLDADGAGEVGRAFGSVIVDAGGERVVMGRDGRLTGPEMSAAFAEGVRAAGCSVVDVGVVPTPVVYFGLHHLDVDGGAMVTASHNPAEYNGFKLCLGTRSMHGEAIKDLHRMIEREGYSSGSGRLEKTEIVDPYVDMITERVRLERSLRIGLDAGNGVAGPLALRLYEALGCEVIPLYCDIDGSFPNHHPDPTLPEAVVDLQRAVVEGGLDLGIGLDGDGDRVGLIDEGGNIVWGDRLTILLARDLLQRNPGAKVVYDVKCSRLLPEDVERHGGEPIMWKTGHSLVKEKMWQEEALLGGEMSGHLFFGENFFGHDDALYAGAKLMQIATLESRPFSELLSDLPPMFSTPEIRRPSTEDKKFVVCERLREALVEEYDVIELDGVRVEFVDGWGLARASNTGPIIVLRFEARTADRLREIQSLVEGKLETIESELGVWQEE